MKIVFKPLNELPKKKKADCEYVSMYKSGARDGFKVGDVAISLRREVSAAGLNPTIQEWDFCTIAMAVAAADGAIPRTQSADGWTRQIEIEVALKYPAVWKPHLASLEETFKFLTGDFWKINVTSGGLEPPKPRTKKVYKATCVSLLSGGLDSLVGAIDLCSNGETPIFVSKKVTGDADKQADIAKALGAGSRHFQWSYNSRSTLEGDDQTRGRSIIFLAYAVLASSALKPKKGQYKKIVVPENGFISLNVPLSPGRIGSHSTKTTHPVYLEGLEKILNKLKINVRFVRPYQFKTKGEMLKECKNQKQLKTLMANTTSCGIFARNKKTHCGVCIPCLVRRSAFLAFGMTDPTKKSKVTKKSYSYEKIKSVSNKTSSTNVNAAARSILLARKKGIDRVIKSALLFSSVEDRDKYKGVIERGLGEIGALLIEHKVL